LYRVIINDCSIVVGVEIQQKFPCIFCQTTASLLLFSLLCVDRSATYVYPFVTTFRTALVADVVAAFLCNFVVIFFDGSAPWAVK
jgi:hypothetical protein